jgi:Protein of unknown function (DUF3237)
VPSGEQMTKVSLIPQSKGVSSSQTVCVPGIGRTSDGSVVWWGKADTPGPPPVVAPGAPASVTVAVSPVRPGHAVTVEYRINGGPLRQSIGLPEPRANNANARTFRAILPGQNDGMVEFLPVLRFAGQPVSPRLMESANCPRYQVGYGALAVDAVGSSESSAASVGEPRWPWKTRFLGSVRVALRVEVVGAVPDGLRINWHVKEGTFVGPGLDAVVLPGATDWMRIRRDGIGVVNVNACIETRTGTRIYSSYGGYSTSARRATNAPCATSSIRCLHS